ncbi:MAG: hypothetical protein QOD38_828 [Acidimicrobiaceae bacterium]|jgi:hypothetical protein
MQREQRRGRRLQGDRGAALVEAAIILPFLALLVFGIVELGFLFRSATIVSSSTRAGARLAAAQYAGAKTAADRTTVLDNVRQTVEKDLQSRGSTDTPIELLVYKANPNGDPLPSGDFSSCSTDCLVFGWNSGAAMFDPPSGAWIGADGCGKVIDSIGVWLRVRHVPIGFSSVVGTIDLKEKTVMRLEPRSDCTTPE